MTQTEVDSERVDIACQRIEQAQQQGKLFDPSWQQAEVVKGQIIDDLFGESK